ncbi:sensor histidine kinase [Deltaproteobacteria bacterium]|nr:sensor histidine kinase [Deltaproteobacteria bacterium]
MMRRHLYLQIYAAFVLIGVMSVCAAGFVAQTLFDGRKLPDPLGPVAALVAEQIDPADPKASTAAVGERLHLRLTLWDEGLHPLGWNGELLKQPDPREGEVQWLKWEQGPAAAVRLADGRWLGLSYSWAFDHRHFLIGLGVLIAVTSALTLPLARRITRRLERLRAVVDRWGAGELGARFPVHGRDEVAELGRGFNLAADKVQGLLDSQRKMLASASHELRSPLARVRMAVELLDDGTPEQTALVAGVGRDIEELDELVGDLLLASRLQARPEPGPRERVDLLALAVEEGARVGAEVRGVAASVSADPRMLRRAVRNLLENARRYGGSASVEVEISAAGARVLLSVLDRGPGVPEADRARIFEPFFRVGGHAEGRDGGVGLGLALVRDIAQHHGGEVRYSPREGGGSRFEVELAAG